MREDLTGQQALGLSFVASLAAGLVIWAATRKTEYSPNDLVTPERVLTIARSFPQDEEGFALAAIGWVRGHIQYKPLSTDITFEDGHIRCSDCIKPLDSLVKGEGNCVTQALLLTSLLRNLFPADRVYTTLGSVSHNGVSGHAWVLLEKDGWLIMDSTTARDFIPVENQSYCPSIYFNDKLIVSEPGEKVCIKASKRQ